jgi:hypothetical protein
MLEDPSVSTQTQWRLATNSYNKKSVPKSKEKKENFYLSIIVGLSIIFAVFVYIFVTYF